MTIAVKYEREIMDAMSIIKMKRQNNTGRKLV